MTNVRCLNVVNFIRENEPRFPMDMVEPVREQMAILRDFDVPATWPLQYDALVGGRFCELLQRSMPSNHEVALWLEMNVDLCRDAKVEWRGRPGYGWDYLPPVAYTLGYRPEERLSLADTAMERFRALWGHYPATVSCWNLDALTMAHLSDHYGVVAFGVCRDQITTDGYTIWGPPFSGYYPSRCNAWSPAQTPDDQINSPVLRLLAQDPVYCYDDSFPLPDGTRLGEPDTLEPAWSLAKDEGYVRAYFRMLESGPTQQFAYAQIGQENTFPWERQKDAYPLQIRLAAEARAQGTVTLETLAETGARFRATFAETPIQAQVQPEDPIGHVDRPQSSAWYASKHYRTNLHVSDGTAWLRDLTVYRQGFPQPFLSAPTRDADIEQRMLSALDAFHWRPDRHSHRHLGCGGYFLVEGSPVRTHGMGDVAESSGITTVDFGSLSVAMSPTEIELRGERSLKLDLRWDAARSTFVRVESSALEYCWQGFDYAISVERGAPKTTDRGVCIESDDGQIVLRMV